MVPGEQPDMMLHTKLHSSMFLAYFSLPETGLLVVLVLSYKFFSSSPLKRHYKEGVEILHQTHPRVSTL